MRKDKDKEKGENEDVIVIDLWKRRGRKWGMYGGKSKSVFRKVCVFEREKMKRMGRLEKIRKHTWI